MNVNIFTLLTVFSWLMAVEPTILTDGLETALPSFQKQWSLPVEGIVMDIEIPKADNHVYYVTEDDEKFRLYKTTLVGNTVWVREWDKGKPYYYVYGLKVSENGDIVCVHTVDGSEENVRTRVYDGDGNVTFYDTHGGYHMGFYYPSPSGLYLSYEDPNNFSPFEIYTPQGEIVTIVNQSFLKGERHTHRFVANDQLLVYEGFKGKGYLYLITVPDGNLLWTYEFESPLWLIDFNERNCAYTDQYIAIQGTRRPSDVYLFDYNGNLLWKVRGFFSNHAISFSSDGGKIILVDKGDTVVMIDTDSGKILNRLKIEKGGMIGRPQFDMSDKLLFITQSFAFGKVKNELGVKRYFSHILKLNSDGIKKEDYIIKEVMATKYDSVKSELMVISPKSEKHKISKIVKYVEK